MNRHRAGIALAVLAALSVSACSFVSHNGTTHRIGSPPYTQGSGKTATADRQLGSFHRVSAETGVSVTLRHGSRSSAKVTADDNLLSMIKTDVRDGTLTVSVDGSLETQNPLQIDVTAADVVDAIEAKEGSTLDSEDLTADALTANAHSGSTLRAGGRAKTLLLQASTGSTADLRNVEVESATVTIDSGSTAFVKATSSVSGTCNGGSTVHVGGNPKTNTVSKDTSSSVVSD